MSDHVCPWWAGYLLANPVRALLQNPQRILKPYLQNGMQALDVGAAMGFFSLPMAKLVGATGRVVCVDLQERMIRGLQQRAARAGLADRIDARVCSRQSLKLDDLAGTLDFALAFAMVHEVPDQARLLAEIRAALRPGGTLLVCEPVGHVPADPFAATVALARHAGFDVTGHPRAPFSRCVLLTAA
ncbi:MAG TPA: class I SAM-dependent methyltransferase [Opitutaceae bacterium]|nr:class I SAM-dependent methyltransferase [Opitutaceae bacterium]